MKIAGLVLVALGLLALLYGGIDYRRNRTVLEVGSVHATVTEQKRLTVPPLVGGILVLAGAALAFSPRRPPRS